MTESEIAKDYADASAYITDFYSVKESIIDDYGDATKGAIFNFFLTSSIKEEKVDFSVFGLLIDITFTLLPHTQFVKKGVEKFIKMAKTKIKYDFLDDLDKEKVKAIAGVALEKAEEKAKGALKNLDPSAVEKTVDETTANNFTLRASENSILMKAVLRSSVIFEREVYREVLSLIFDQQTAKRGQLKNLIMQILGQKPSYLAKDIVYFGKQFELELYKKFYASKTSIKIHKVIYTGSQKLIIDGLPLAVQTRILELTGLPNIIYAISLWNVKWITTSESGVSTGA